MGGRESEAGRLKTSDSPTLYAVPKISFRSGLADPASGKDRRSTHCRSVDVASSGAQNWEPRAVDVAVRTSAESRIRAQLVFRC